MAKPFIKWAGGKSQLISEIMQRLPKYIQQGKPYFYIEPFCGSSAVALQLLASKNPPTQIIINDINSDLINLYQVVQKQPQDLLNYLQTIQVEYDQLIDKEDKKPYYYKMRAEFNQRNSNKVKQAGLFIFLNRAGFNGLYRVNSKNEFNVPIGSYKQPRFVFEEVILTASDLLKNANIINTGFEDTLNHIEKYGNNLPVFFYFDPPYKPISDSSSFTSYAKNSFNDDDQKKLQEFCQTLDNKGYQWLLSNSDTTNTDTNNTFFDDLYNQYTVERVKASRSINSKGSGRGQINELLIKNY